MDGPALLGDDEETEHGRGSPSGPRRVLVMWDYTIDIPLWDIDEDVDIEALPLPPDLWERLRQWADESTRKNLLIMDQLMPRRNAAKIGANLNTRGWELARDVRAALGPGYVVGYYDTERGKTFWMDPVGPEP